MANGLWDLPVSSFALLAWKSSYCLGRLGTYIEIIDLVPSFLNEEGGITSQTEVKHEISVGTDTRGMFGHPNAGCARGCHKERQSFYIGLMFMFSCLYK